MTMEGTVIEILGYPSRFFRRDAIMPATIEPRKAATAGGTAAISTSSRRNVLATAPISAAAAAIETGLLNMMEKPKTPQKPAINRRRKSNNGAISKGRKSVGTKSRSIAMIQAVSVATSTMISCLQQGRLFGGATELPWFMSKWRMKKQFCSQTHQLSCIALTLEFCSHNLGSP